MSIASMKPNINSVLVTEANLPTGIIFKNKHLITNINCWHKFIIGNSENVQRNVVLRAILDHVHPLDLIPVAFGKDKSGSYFVARNCGGAIQKLANDNLIVPNPNDTRPFKLSIILKFATTTEFKIDVQKNIQNVLNKRYDAVKKILNLSRFHEDPDLTEFCPLSQPKIMFFVLHLSKNLSPLAERYILSDNRIRVLNPLEAICGPNIVVSLDLKNNLIEDMKILQPLKTFKIQELVLDGNPVCDHYDHESYVNEIKNFCINLQRLDGIWLKDGNYPISKNNFVCDHNGIDLVNQFLEHYFSLYDSSNRRMLKELYHGYSMFSLNTTYLYGQISSAKTEKGLRSSSMALFVKGLDHFNILPDQLRYKSLRHYSNMSRNLKKVADVSRNSQFLYRGYTEISNVLCNLPQTEHDPFSFKVDLIYRKESCAIIGVSGVFRELPENLLASERHYGFRRTFVLETSHPDGICYITNEQLHIYNATSQQVINSFKVSKPTLTQHLMVPPQNEREYQLVINTFRIISNMNSEWAKKCLEECNYDLRNALLLFVDLYKADKIPSEGFHNKKKQVSRFH